MTAQPDQWDRPHRLSGGPDSATLPAVLTATPASEIISLAADDGVPVTLTTLFCDLVSSTEMLSRLGDQRALAVQRDVLARLRNAVAAARGQHVKALGDGVMAIFTSCAAAVDCATRMHRALGASPVSEVRSLSLRVGLSVGEVVAVDGDFFGSSLVEAARLCAMAIGGQTLATAAVEVVMGAAGSGLFRPLGHLPVRGLPGGLDVVALAGAPTSGPAREKAHGPCSEDPEELLSRAVQAWPDSAVAAGPSASLIGRQAEIEAVRSCLRRAQDSDEQVLLLCGEAGIGKSRLLDEAAAQALTRGFRVASGSCHDGLGAPSYWPWVQVLRSVAAQLSDGQLAAAAGAGVAVLVAAVPELQHRLPAVPAVPTEAPERVRFQLFDAVAGFLTRVATTAPLLVTIDDLHWADAASLELLHFVMRTDRTTRLALITTVRDDALEAHHPLARLLGDLTRHPCLHRLELRGLRPPDAAALLAYTLGVKVPEPVVIAVHRYTAGNPLFMAEVGRLLLSEDRLGAVRPDGRLLLNRVPAGIRGVIGRRLDQLSASCLPMLEVTAVDGTDITLETLAQTLGLGREHLAGPIDEALEASILTSPAPGVLRYTHALVRDTVLESMRTGERARWERRLALVLERGCNADDPVAMARLAEHFVNAAQVLGAPQLAIRYATAAARAAAATGAHAVAATHLKNALALLPTTEQHGSHQARLLLELGDALRRNGETAAARRIFTDLLHEPVVKDDTELFAQAALGLGCGLGGYGFADRVDPGLIAALERALRGLADQPGALRVRVLSRLALELHFTGNSRRRMQLAERALQEARELADPTMVLVAMYSANWTALTPDRLAERVAAGANIERLAEEIGDAEMCFRGRLLQLLGRLEQGDTSAAHSDLKALAELAQALDQPLYHWQVGVLRAMELLRAGMLEEAQREADTALHIGQDSVGSISLVMYGSQMLYLHWARGSLAEVASSVARFAETYPHAPAWRAALAFLYAESGELVLARAEFAQLADLSALPSDGNWLTAVGMLGWTCVRLHDADAAEGLMGALLPYVDRDLVMAAGAVTFGSVSHLLGALALVRGDRPAAQRWVSAAHARYARQNAPAMSSWSAQTLAGLAVTPSGHRQPWATMPPKHERAGNRGAAACDQPAPRSRPVRR
ncbi:MAG: hypothetical protein NVS3B26_22800 [Mycobacteriales bacterium]